MAGKPRERVTLAHGGPRHGHSSIIIGSTLRSLPTREEIEGMRPTIERKYQGLCLQMEIEDLQPKTPYVRGGHDIYFHEDIGSYLPVDALDRVIEATLLRLSTKPQSRVGHQGRFGTRCTAHPC